MRKGLTALAVVVVAAAVALYLLTTPAPARMEGTSPTAQTPTTPTPSHTPAPQTSAATATYVVTPAKTETAATAREANYTVFMTVQMGDVTAVVEGWFVLGLSRIGNYSFGRYAIHLLTFEFETESLSVSKDGFAYVKACAEGTCELRRMPNDASLWHVLGGFSATRREVGRCERLGLSGTLYEESGLVKPELAALFWGAAEGVSGSYTATVCETDGLWLATRGVMYLYMEDKVAKINFDIAAVSVGPFNATRYAQLQKQVN